MKISKRSLFSVIALVLTMSITAFGTVAYMTDSDQVTNTFTVGNIDIIVDETDTDGSQTGIVTPGTGDTPTRDQANDYELIPGLEQVKDPRITVKANSEECYVRMRVEMNCIEELQNIYLNYLNKYEADKLGPDESYAKPSVEDVLKVLVDINKNWAYESLDLENNIAVIEFRYVELDEFGFEDGDKIVSTSDTATVLPALFEHFTVPIWMTGMDLEKLNGFYLNVYGDAVQTEAFDDADDAWRAYDYQVLGVGSQPSEEPYEEPTETPAPTEGESAEGGETGSNEGGENQQTDETVTQ